MPARGLLRDEGTALWAVALSSIWANLGFTFIVVTAGLQSIPADMYESAYVDGASAWMRFTNVTVPMLGPTLLFVGVVLTSRAFQSYGEFDLLTGGGPAGSTTSLTYLVYGNNSIIRNNSGLQAAVAVLLFLVLAVQGLVARLDPEEAEIWYDGSNLLSAVKLLIGVDPKKDYADNVARVHSHQLSGHAVTADSGTAT